jgi:hypothetical protein
VRDDLFVSAQQVVDGRHGQRVIQVRRFHSVFEPAPAGQIRHHRGGQQLTVLHHVDAAVGEAALVSQPDGVELEILLRVAAGDEVHRQRARRQVVLQRAAGRDEQLRHHLPTEGAHRILARVRADEEVVVDGVEVENRQQLFKVCR